MSPDPRKFLAVRSLQERPPLRLRLGRGDTEGASRSAGGTCSGPALNLRRASMVRRMAARRRCSGLAPGAAGAVARARRRGSEP
eukprot:14913078-Alexandrium_andersonii.AAC.1